MMANVVFVFCAVTSLVCAILLARGYQRNRVRLLFWSAWCFAAFFVSNIVLIVDVAVMHSTHLLLLRQIPSILGVALLIYGLVWDTDGR